MTLAGLPPDRPFPADRISAFVDGCRWFSWSEPTDEIWYLHIAVEDPSRHRAWALSGQAFD